jgi:hypothetical protein
MVLAPHFDIVRSIRGVPPEKLQHESVLASLARVDWDGPLLDLVRSKDIHRSASLYESGPLGPAFVEAEELVKSELNRRAKTLPSLSGKGFEDLLLDVFRAAGLQVQGRVRIRAAEVDLLLTEQDSGGKKKHTLIECKHFSGTKRRVGISHVLRAIGLRDILKDTHIVENNVVISTTGFSSPAKAVAALRQVELVDYEQLHEWLTAHDLITVASFTPFSSP